MSRRSTPMLITLAALPLAVLACKGSSKGAGDTTAAAPAAATATNPAAPKVDKAAEEQTIRDLSKKFNQAFTAHDTATMRQVFADDGYEMEPGMKAMKGPDEVLKGFEGMLKMVKDFKLSWTPSDVAIADAGDIAVEHGTYQASYTDPKGKKVDDHGNYVTVYKKVNGQWKVAYDINASEVQPQG